MATIGELYLKYRFEKDLFKSLHQTLLKQLEDIANSDRKIYNDDLYIANLGLLGISIIEKEGKMCREHTGSITNFKLNEIWNVTIDKENWQNEALPSVLLKTELTRKLFYNLY